MKLENKDFWEKDTIIITQDRENTVSADFETFMFEQAQIRQNEIRDIENINIFGCGTGREVNEAAKFFNPKKIVASDIAQNMIAKCNYNLKLWNIESVTQTVVGNAKDIDLEPESFELVIIFNSMMTYVPLKLDRLAIFKKSNLILKSNAVIIGTVHHQLGTLSKTVYFKLRNLFSVFLGDKVGNRTTGFNGFKVPGYYYSKKDLFKDLNLSGFSNVEIYSLEEFYKKFGASYNRKTGYNNLIFIASKK